MFKASSYLIANNGIHRELVPMKATVVGVQHLYIY